MAKKIYKTIATIILLTVLILCCTGSRNNSNAVDYNRAYIKNNGTQLLGNSMLYNNYGYNYIPYSGLAFQGNLVFKAMSMPYQNAVKGGEYTINQLLYDPYLYCMNHGFAFKPGNYMCYEVGNINPILAYIVDGQQEIPRHQNDDLEANAVWYYMKLAGEKGSVPGLINDDEFKKLLAKADIVEEVGTNYKNGTPNIIIEKPANDTIDPNAEGKYGPFKITYPNYDGEFIGEDIKIIINKGTADEKVIDKDNMPASGEEFYLTKDDGIKIGEENTLKVEYKGYIYSGTYAKFTPHRDILVERECPQCKERFFFETEGYCKTEGAGATFYKEDEDSELKEVLISGKHTDDCTYPAYAPLGKVTCANEDYKENYQNLIYIKPNKDTFEEDTEIKFTPKGITLKGKVWEDGQIGIKEVKLPNDVFNSGEKLIKNITVILKDESGNKVQETKTNDSGEYIFEKIVPAKYYIQFRYDGINYEAVAMNAVADDIDSDAEEIGRKDFNEKFQTITKNTATGADGTTTALTYKYEDGASGEFDKAILETTNESGVIEDFAMIAQTEPVAYNGDAENIDLGLVKRGVDLGAITGLNSATIEINGQTKTKNYDEITGKKPGGEDYINVIDYSDEVRYNLYLYKSDYNYKINDYTDLPVLSGTAHPTLADADKGALLSDKQYSGELKVKLTYEIHLNNESAADATIDKIAYYYDSNILTIEEIRFQDSITPMPTSDYTIENLGSLEKANIVIGKELNDTDNQGILMITFLADMDKIRAIDGSISEKVNNWVEITSYSTKEGYIDINSAPDNMENYHENDTDSSSILLIENHSSERTISGYVFEDKKELTAYSAGNGKFDTGEEKVNDVIVQLIEVRDINIGGTIKRLEYIWQETTSGSKTVKYITTDGTAISTYDNSDIGEGGYKFEGFIPGKYIVRFIYGDGTYFDKNINGEDRDVTDEKDAKAKANISKYNGQDYKSAIDQNYQKPEYDERDYFENASMARDNEMRRIEEIAYVTSLTKKEDLNYYSSDVLNETWMCAETSDVKIDLGIDPGTDTKISKNINFGLVKRPEVSIEIEKHITALKIDDNICDASVDMDDIKSASTNNYKIELKNTSSKNSSNITSVFVTNKEEAVANTNTNTNKIGIWKIETELDKIQDKNLYITYTYTVKPTGEINSIGSELVDKDLTNVDVIKDIRKDIVDDIYYYKERGKYLGELYYSGESGSSDISDRIENIQIEDYLKNLKMDGVNTDFIEKGEDTKTVIVEINGSNIKQGDEKVNVVQSKENFPILFKEGTPKTINLTVTQKIDVSGGKNLEYRSYVAQLIRATTGTDTGDAFTTKAGLTLKNIGFNNLENVQSYDNINTFTTDVAKESDEFIAETVVISVDTGDTVADSNKEQKLNLAIVVIAGLAIVATGIVLIKKFVIK